MVLRQDDDVLDTWFRWVVRFLLLSLILSYNRVLFGSFSFMLSLFLPLYLFIFCMFIFIYLIMEIYYIYTYQPI